MKYFLLSFCVCLITACNYNNLGGGIYLLEGDRIEDRIIVKCTGKSFSDCIAGEYLIPRSYYDHFDSNGHYLQYVKDVKSGKSYINATSILIKTNEKKYWVIIKNSKPSNEIIGPLDYDMFKAELKKNNIKLSF